MTAVWKIAPGRIARYWDDCQRSSSILLGWRHLVDYMSYETTGSLLRALGGRSGNGKGAVLSIWRFSRDIQLGDIVVANKGRSGIVGIGVVGSDYLPPGASGNPNVRMLPHARSVDWVIRESVSLPPHFFGIATVHALSPTKIDQICIAYSDQHPALSGTVNELFEGDYTPKSDTSGLELATEERKLADLNEFDPSSLQEGRERVLASIVRRRGQSAFRQHLLTAYRGRCAFSGCDVEAVLEAAHIVPYLGPKTNHPANGLLLRADLHTLFDLHLLGVEPPSMRILVSSDLNGSRYESLRGRLVKPTRVEGSGPSLKALSQHCDNGVRLH